MSTTAFCSAPLIPLFHIQVCLVCGKTLGATTRRCLLQSFTRERCLKSRTLSQSSSTAEMMMFQNALKLMARPNVRLLPSLSRHFSIASAGRQRLDAHNEELQERPRLIDCRQGSKTPPVFSKMEMENRVKRLRSFMQDSRIEACVFTSYHNVNYFSNFLYCYFGRPYALVVTPDETTIIAANIDYGQPWRVSVADAITYTDWQKDSFYHAVQKLVGKRCKIGLEYDHINVTNLGKMKNALPKAEFTDVADDTMQMRMIKSDEEIDLIKNGARIADLGGFACRDTIGENVPEHEVALSSTRVMIREIANTYPNVELMDTWTWFQSGINTDGAHNPVTSRKIQKGDILNLNCFPMIAGYYTALERTLFFDHASDRSLEIWEANCKVHKRGLELLRPGNKCGEIAAELNEIFREHGLLKYRTFGYGHSFGVLCHYYGREAGLELREDIDTVLQPNMVISMEPMVTIPDGMAGAGGYREHDIMVIKEDGAENITKFPYGPEHNIVKAK